MFCVLLCKTEKIPEQVVATGDVTESAFGATTAREVSEDRRKYYQGGAMVQTAGKGALKEGGISGPCRGAQVGMNLICLRIWIGVG